MTITLPPWLLLLLVNLAALAGIFCALRLALRRFVAVRAGRLFLVGRVTGRVSWDFQGVFTTEAAAIAACKKKNYFFLVVDLDQELPEAPVEGEGLTFPLRPEKKGAA